MKVNILGTDEAGGTLFNEMLRPFGGGVRNLNGRKRSGSLEAKIKEGKLKRDFSKQRKILFVTSISL